MAETAGDQAVALTVDRQQTVEVAVLGGDARRHGGAVVDIFFVKFPPGKNAVLVQAVFL